MNFENEYLIKLNKYVKDKCSKICDFEKVDEKILMNYDSNFNINDLKLFKENFQCFDKCSAKYFELGIFSLESLSKFLENNKK